MVGLTNGLLMVSHTHTKSQITDFPSSLPASDVYAWAKASTKPSYTYSEVGAAAASHSHTKSQITDFPDSLPASDVYSWAKASSKPTYTAAEVGAAEASEILYNGAATTERTISNYKNYKFLLVVCKNSNESSITTATLIPCVSVTTESTGSGFGTSKTSPGEGKNWFQCASDSVFISLYAYHDSTDTTGYIGIRAGSTGNNYIKTIIGVY